MVWLESHFERVKKAREENYLAGIRAAIALENFWYYLFKWPEFTSEMFAAQPRLKQQFQNWTLGIGLDRAVDLPFNLSEEEGDHPRRDHARRRPFRSKFMPRGVCTLLFE